MDYTKIITVTGKSGLFKVLAQNKSGLIAESLLDGRKTPVSAAHKITTIEDIVVFTITEEIKLIEVFKKIKAASAGEKAIDSKSTDAELRAFFKHVLPDYDEERVYVSHIKKIVSWYNLLYTAGLLEFDEPEAANAPETDSSNQQAIDTDTTIENNP